MVVSPLSVVPLKIGKNNCKPGETHRKTLPIGKIPTLDRVNLAEDRHQHSSGGLPKMSWDKNLPLEPVFALDTLRNRVNTTLKNNQNRNNTQEADYRLLSLS
mgnify:CR=1 FL=1